MNGEPSWRKNGEWVMAGSNDWIEHWAQWVLALVAFEFIDINFNSRDITNITKALMDSGESCSKFVK